MEEKEETALLVPSLVNTEGLIKIPCSVSETGTFATISETVVTGQASGLGDFDEQVDAF